MDTCFVSTCTSVSPAEASGHRTQYNASCIVGVRRLQILPFFFPFFSTVCFLPIADAFTTCDAVARDGSLKIARFTNSEKGAPERAEMQHVDMQLCIWAPPLSSMDGSEFSTCRPRAVRDELPG